MAWYDDLEDAPDWKVVLDVHRRAHVGKRLWWWVVGMPSAEELRERYAPFTEREETRIRELARQEMGHQSDSGRT
jgi:hypothetical protein